MLEATESIIPWQHLHPIFVNFSAALVPSSVVSDVLGKFIKNESLKSAGWWMIFYATLITPLTVIAGWFWKTGIPAAALPEDLIFIHQWLGTLLILLFAILTIWRGWLFYKGKDPNFLYFVIAAIVVGALAYQGHLGGKMVFG